MKKRAVCWPRARFVSTALGVSTLPVLKDSHGKDVPEVALLGRSNVGKSSLLNYLFQVKGLVKTSSTPGKTQHLNLFAIDDAIAFADLPGYGYAKVPPSIREGWAAMIQGYLEQRQALKVLMWLFDARRTPTEEDRRLLTWFAECGKAVLLVLTKTDQITPSQLPQRIRSIEKELGCDHLCIIPVSAHKRIGRDVLLATLLDAITDELKEEI